MVDQLTKAGAYLVGGHSIDDDTLKFGLSVSGIVTKDRLWTNKNACVGDQLILTKPLGTGTLMAGLKAGDYKDADIQDAYDSMTQLNQISDLLSENEVTAIHAATDVTGFGLAGHALNLAKGSSVSLQIKSEFIPQFSLSIESLRNRHLTKAHSTNKEYVEEHLFIEKDISKELELLFFDPQTSGGLLLAVDSQSSDAIVTKLKQRFNKVSVIGKVIAKKNNISVFLE